MHHLTCGISSLLHSVNLILFTVLLVHLMLCISTHHSHHLHSYLTITASAFHSRHKTSDVSPQGYSYHSSCTHDPTPWL